MNRYPLSYKLNQENVKLFIETADTSVQDTLRKLMATTEHFPFEYFITLLNKNLRQLSTTYLTNNRPLFAYIDVSGKNDYKHKSNYWLYMYVKKTLDQPVTFISDLNDTMLQDNDNIMLLDDCLYSGGQMSSTIRGLKLGEKRFNIILMVSFMSDYGLQKVHDAFHDVNHNSKLIMPIHVHYIQPITNFIPNDDVKQLFSFYNIVYDRPRYPVYFDHKLADNESSCPEIYSGIVPNNKNKMLLKEIKTIKIKSYNPVYTKQKTKLEQEKHDIESRLDIYPLLTNCENIRNTDLMKPMCPHPPYKEGYETFIRSLNKQTTVRSRTKRSV